MQEATIESRIALLNQARAALTACVEAQVVIEEKDGPNSDAVNAFVAITVDPAIDAVGAAEKRLADTRCSNAADALRKVQALMVDGVLTEIRDTVMQDVAKVLTTLADDPIVPLCRRLLNLRKTMRIMVDACPTGNFDGPDFLQAEAAANDLVDQITTMTPTSAEGVSLLTQVMWESEGPDSLIGTDGWIAEMESIPNVFMRRLSHGAAIVAGL